ncbi:RagB/SusD family nutrient uptake outer membrane protein [Puteibacter caeruleilacunae]|nr:RagB/SusD family nutrient uptake outer membrane protein [Puteibacter caeruleilacunae]
MYKNIKYIFLAFLAIGGMACNDFFETDKDDIIAGDKNYQSIQEITNTIVGINGLIQDVADQNIILNSLLSDEVLPSTVAPDEFFQIEQRKVSAENKFGDPSDYYKIVVNCNDLLATLDTTDIINVGFDSEEAKAIRLQAYTSRAWAYINLSYIYGKVRYFYDPLIEFDEQKVATFPELTQDELVEKLIGELESHKGDIGYVNWGEIMGDNDGEWNLMRIPFNLLLGNLYLMADRYSDALSQYLILLNDVEGNKYTISSKYGFGKWSEIFTKSITSNSNEIYTAVPYSKSNFQQHELQSFFTWDLAPDGLGYLVPSDTVVSSFELQSNNFEQKGDFQRLAASIGVIPSMDKSMVYKYTIGRQAYDNNAPIILYRAADVHLAMAECFNRLGDADIALALLNDGLQDFWLGSEWDEVLSDRYSIPEGLKENVGIRGRVNLKPYVLDDESTQSEVHQVEEFIANEYLLEMAFEGKRWPALVRIAKRWMGDDGATGASFLADRIATKSNASSAMREELMDPENWYIKR